MLYTNYAEAETEVAKTLLSQPGTKRQEIRDAKAKLDEFAAFKESHKFVGRRERVIKNGWKHGVTGLDNADSENTSIFYQDSKKRKDSSQADKDKINAHRLQSK